MEMEEDRILVGFHQKYRKKVTKLGMTDILKGRVSRRGA
jgi:hypothetical protein